MPRGRVDCARQDIPDSHVFHNEYLGTWDIIYGYKRIIKGDLRSPSSIFF